jgi:hypothetical protein
MKNKNLIIALIFVLTTLGCENHGETIEQGHDFESLEYQENVLSTSWANFKYDSVVTYLYRVPNSDGAMGEFPHSIVIQGQLNSSILPRYTKRLSESEITQFNRVMNGGQEEVAVNECYEPHHGVVFYQNDSIIAHVSICLMCNNLKSSPTALNGVDPKRLIPLFERNGFPIKFLNL